MLPGPIISLSRLREKQDNNNKVNSAIFVAHSFSVGMGHLQRQVQDSTTNWYIRPLSAGDGVNVPDSFKTRSLFHISFRLLSISAVWGGAACPVGKSMCEHYRGGRKKKEAGGEAAAAVSSKDVEARGVKQGKFHFLFCPSGSRTDQVLLSLFLYCPLFNCPRPFH